MHTRAVTARGVASLIGSAIAAAALCALPAAGPAVALAASASVGAQSSPSLPNSSPSPANSSASSASSPSAWSRLWWNRDQQGERMLESGDAAGAAQRFRDPQRRAYADLQAGRYTEAAQLLAPFKDPESQYNRGNALARAGQLQAALAAYDAALARAPGDHDTRHNRDLVARALTQQPPRSQQSQQPPRSQQRSPHGSQRGSKQGSQQGSRQGSAAGTPRGPQSGGSPSGGGASHAGTGQEQAAAGNNPMGAGHSGATGRTAGESAHDAQDAQSARRSGSSASQSSVASQSSAAASHATPGAAAQTGTQQSTQQGAPQGGLLAQAQRRSAGTATPDRRPPSEQALSLDQWLRRLPDDPGGLLRRKFLIEHLMRRQDQPQGAQ